MKSKNDQSKIMSMVDVNQESVKSLPLLSLLLIFCFSLQNNMYVTQILNSTTDSLGQFCPIEKLVRVWCYCGKKVSSVNTTSDTSSKHKDN